MKNTETKARDIAAEHALYLERIEPMIHQRLADRGLEQARIDAYIAELPEEHFMIQIRRAIAAMRLSENPK